MSGQKIKEATVFCSGDSRKKSTWSGLPYLFTDSLLSKGIQVNRVDISESPNAKWWFDRTIRRIVRRIHPATTYEYFRSGVHFWRTRQKIKNALRDYPNSDANFFLTYSHSSSAFSEKPAILLSDWTYHYNITHFLGRKPDFFERSTIKREDHEINRASLVFSTFPDVTNYMVQRYKNKNIHFIGKSSFSMRFPSESEIIPLKNVSKDILFIGNSRYREGAESLMSAYQKVKTDLLGIQLHIIGMRNEEFPYCPDGVHFYGYLNKDVPKQEELYYSLLKRARVFVNTTPKLASAGAMVEAMNFFTPIIITPTNYMTNLFGDKIDFGHYCSHDSLEILCAKIKAVFETKDYASLCANAHSSVAGFSFLSRVEQILDRIQA